MRQGHKEGSSGHNSQTYGQHFYFMASKTIKTDREDKNSSRYIVWTGYNPNLRTGQPKPSFVGGCVDIVYAVNDKTFEKKSNNKFELR